MADSLREKPAVLSQSDCISRNIHSNCPVKPHEAEASSKTEGSMAERVKRVIELMEVDPSRSFTLGKMAESVNLSAPYFCYLFKTITGVPPAKYLKSLRMQQAATLLTTTFLSVKEIVRHVGLTDESHFVRDFKRLYGMTPSEYRNSALLSSDLRNIDRPSPPTNRKIGQ